ncbi:family 10 glycosylhydrolase [Paenibacillus nasutitermitis]|uniref:Family 10 glycosylhydrolase n=1 Tax=Paenibacillus nasutitermitis TaxID=1652958 RepID=A0A916YY52_9BACL|nr:family 10 glycosylhydrolase [Paenibacillus nasutitermitis]GGD66888.1 hypothetical protein GCM10010911_25810 [Paenibacillus nasutitermitis]
MTLRKCLAVLLFVVLWSQAAAPSVSAETPKSISIFLDGQQIKSDVSPYIVPKADTTLVPLRVISEGLGASVDWEQLTKSVTISWPETMIKMTAGQTYALVNENKVKLGTTVTVKQGRVMVPLRFVGEQLGLQVNWNQKAYSITLLSNSLALPVDPVEPVDPVAPSPPVDPTLPLPPVDSGNGNNGSSAGLRGTWVSTVYNLDWPSAGSYGNKVRQQDEFIKLLDELQDMGMNAVFVQVRPAADALYNSSLVPWSTYLTGTSGKAPDYDPLAFMIGETHKRGMEFHAWFNPFRASTDTTTSKLASNHVVKQHPEWIVKSGDKLYINPGIPQARQHIIDTIMEVVRQYDVDGIHLDDYFYPSGGTFGDDVTFRTYNSNRIAKLADWRRDNINEFVQQLGVSIHSAKPQVQFGISPFGVWRNKAMDATGSDTKAGVTAYDSMYADVRTWIKKEWIDYVVPQIYWSFSFTAAPYGTLVNWWSDEVRGTDVKLYIGHSPYKLGTSEAGWQSANEIIDQLTFNAQVKEVSGEVFFSAKDLRKNPLGLLQALSSYYALN